MEDKRQGEDRREPTGGRSDRRSEERKKQRVTCEILDGDRMQRGVVRDVSTSGLFVQTALPIEVGSEIEVQIMNPSSEATSPIIFVRAIVARKLMIDRRLSSLASGGLGLRITAAPPTYYEALGVPPPSDAEIETPLTRSPEKGEPAAASKPEPNFRIRVGQGPRSYWLSLAADSESDAVRQAAAQAGEGWKVLEVALHDESDAG